jgi:SSS family solute:Na+ symporter
MNRNMEATITMLPPITVRQDGNLSRLLSLLLMVLAILMCLVFTDTLTWLTATYAYSAAALACPIFLSYAFRKKNFITTPGVIAGMVFGLVGCAVAQIMETSINYAAIGIGISFVAMMVVCALTRSKGAVNLDD